MVKDIPKAEGSPSEVGPAVAASEASGEHQELDHFTDDEPDTELVALQHLPPEERRKALRRLRNRESARRVRARRLAEMSQMGSTLQNLQDENAALKSHVSKLQSHVQSMTLKVYEVTAKYESAVAENAQLRIEVLRFRRPSAPGDSSFVAPTGNGAAAAAAAAAANGPNSAPLNQLSPFIAPLEQAGGAGEQTLSPGHVQLRSSSPRDLQQQRQALEEVVMLLKEHKRRNQDRTGGSEIGSCGAGGNNVTSTHSPTSDTPLMVPAPPLGGFAASALGTNNSSTNGLPYNVGDMSCFMGGEGTGASDLGSGRGCQFEVPSGPQQPLPQLQAGHRWGVEEGTGMGSSEQQQMALCSPLLPGAHHPSLHHRNSTNTPSSNMRGQIQPQPMTQAPLHPHQLLGNPGPAASLSLPLPSHQPQLQLQHQVQQQQQQQQQALGQSHSHPLGQVQLPHHQQLLLFDQQQQLQGMGSAALYGTMSPLSLSAPFYSAMSVLPGGGTVGGGGLQMPVGHNSGPTALGSGICGLDSMAAAAAAQAMGTGGHSSQRRSASYALDRGTGATSAQNVVAMHPTWQANAGNGAAGVAMLAPEDISEDMLMSLDEYVPQDL